MGLTQKLGTIPLAILTDTSNNVGIGGSPSGSYKLEVTGTAKVSSTLLVSGAATLSSSLTATSTITSNNAIGVEKNGSGTFGGGGRFYLYNAATTDGMLMQLNASNNIDYWGVTSNTATASPVITFTRAGAATFSGSITMTGDNLVLNGTNTAIVFQNGGSTKGYNAIVTSTGAYVPGSIINDIIYRSNGNNFLWSVDSGSSCAMKLTSGGNVGIGNTGSSTYKLLVTGNTTDGSTFSFYAFNSANVDLFGIRTDGAIYTGAAGNSPYNLTTPSAANCFINTNGYLYRSTSSLKYKKNIQDYTKGLAEVLQLRPVSYESINEEEAGNIYAGLIAEEVHNLGLTEFVQYRTDGTPDALSYANMIALLTKAIQEQNQTIQSLQEQNQDLKSRLDKAGL